MSQYFCVGGQLSLACAWSASVMFKIDQMLISNCGMDCRVVLEWVARSMEKPAAEVAAAALRNSNRLFPCR